MKWGIIYEKIAMRAGDDGRVTNHEWPYNVVWLAYPHILC